MKKTFKRWISLFVVMMLLFPELSLVLAEYILPANLSEIKAGAFYGNTVMTEITLPHSVRTIGSKAFAYSGLEYVYMPEEISFIADDAFIGTEDLHAAGLPDTYASSWCAKNNIPFNIHWKNAPYLTAESTDEGALLSWWVEEMAEGYYIYEVIDGSEVKIASARHVTEYIVPNADDAVHQYAVRPYKTVKGELRSGKLSNYASYQNHDVLWKTVSSMSASVYDNDVLLTWSTKELSEGYHISEVINGVKTVVATAGAVTHYELKNVSAGNHTYVIEPFKTKNGVLIYGSESKAVTATVSLRMVESITLNTSSLELNDADTYTLLPEVYPADADDRTVSWKSSNTNVATVSQEGVVTAVGGGIATITATANDGSGVSASCVVQVFIIQPNLTISHPVIGDVIETGEVTMFNGQGHQTWTVTSNYPCRIEQVGNWFRLDRNSFDAGSNTLVINIDDGVEPGVIRTGKVKFYIEDSLYVTINIRQDGGIIENIVIDPSISVHHPLLGDIFEAGTFEMWNGFAHQTWNITANCDWTITKSGEWFNVDRLSGSAGNGSIIINIADGVAAGQTRNGSISFYANGKHYKTVNFKQVGPNKALTVKHATLGDVFDASPVQVWNGFAHQTWTVESNANWTLSKSGTWFTISQTSGSAGTSTIVLNFPDGAEPGEVREGTVNFYFDGVKYGTIKLYQDGGEEEIDTDPAYSIAVTHPFVGNVVDADYVMMHNSPATMTWTVNANFDWKISTTNANWYTVSPMSGSAGTTTVKVTTTGYTTGLNTGTISFKKGNSTKAKITIKQGGEVDHEDSFSVSHPQWGNLLDQDTIYMFNGYGTQNWTVMSNVDWTLSKSGTWFTITPTSGSANTASSQSTNIRLTINSGVEAGEEREGNVKFTYYINGRKRTSTVYIAQYGGPAQSGEIEKVPSMAVSHALLGNVFEASPIEMHNADGEMNWSITSNTAWTIKTSGTWFSVSRTSGSANTESTPTTNLKITIPNGVGPGGYREGSITFYLDGEKYRTVNFYQDGGDVPSMTVGSADFGDIFRLSTIPLSYSTKDYEWTVNANREWSVEKYGSWFSISPVSGAAETSSTLRIKVNDLPAAGEALNGSLIFYLDGCAYKMIELSLTNPNGEVITPEDEKLPAPTNLNAVATSNTRNNIAWNNVNGASGYNIYRSQTAYGGFIKLNSTLIKTLTWTDTSISAGTNYYYTVEAVSASGIPGSRTQPFGPVSYNASCSFNVSPQTCSLSYGGETKTIQVSKHASNSYKVSIVQYNSEGTLCTNETTADNHKKAYWLTSSLADSASSASSFTLIAGKNYANTSRMAVVTITCDCGATHNLVVNQGSGEPAPASVTIKMDGSGGFSEASSIKMVGAKEHMDYVLIPGDTIAVNAAGGVYSRRLTVRISDPNGNIVYDESSTSASAGGISKTHSYIIPDGCTEGAYTVTAYAANCVEAGSDAQFINVNVRIRVMKKNTSTPSGLSKVSEELIEFLRKREGCYYYMYDDLDTSNPRRRWADSDQKGTPTIGMGHVVSKGSEDYNYYLTHDITWEEAMILKEADIQRYIGYAERFTTETGISLNQHQFDALVSYFYNCGYRSDFVSFFKGKQLSNITDKQIYNIFAYPVTSQGVWLAGLYTRRMDEATMFLRGTYYSANYNESSWSLPSWWNNPTISRSMIPSDWYPVELDSLISVPKDDIRMSAEYKTSIFYTKLKEVKLTGNYANDIVNVARSQIGYLESKDFTGTGAYDDNHTEYNNFYGASDVSWCAYFVCWCAGRAGVPTSAIELDSYAVPFGLCPKAKEIALFLSEEEIGAVSTDYKSYLDDDNVKYYTQDRSKFVPKAGDLIFFHKSDKSAMWGHVGIVTGCSGNDVYFIDGNNNGNGSPKDGTSNVSGKVYERKVNYTQESSYVIGFARPKY